MTHVSLKREKRRIELSDHAIHCFAEQGYAETSLRDIAAAAGINLGRLHYYFGSKTDLVTFAIRRYKSSYITNLNCHVPSNEGKSARHKRDDQVQSPPTC